MCSTAYLHTKENLISVPRVLLKEASQEFEIPGAKIMGVELSWRISLDLK